MQGRGGDKGRERGHCIQINCIRDIFISQRRVMFMVISLAEVNLREDFCGQSVRKIFPSKITCPLS